MQVRNETLCVYIQHCSMACDTACDYLIAPIHVHVQATCSSQPSRHTDKVPVHSQLGLDCSMDKRQKTFCYLQYDTKRYSET